MTPSRFTEGDRVRVDIPDEADPDYAQFHGQHGEVIDVVEDDAGKLTGDARDNVSYVVAFANGQQMHFRWRDLRPPIDGE